MGEGGSLAGGGWKERAKMGAGGGRNTEGGGVKQCRGREENHRVRESNVERGWSKLAERANSGAGRREAHGRESNAGVGKKHTTASASRRGIWICTRRENATQARGGIQEKYTRKTAGKHMYSHGVLNPKKKVGP